jgi:hypothetical protein
LIDNLIPAGIRLAKRDNVHRRLDTVSNLSAILHWRRSTRCNSGYCVEVAQQPGRVLVRDAKDPGSGTLAFDPAAWQGFLADLRNGSFDGQ